MPPLSQQSINFLADTTMDQEPEWWKEQEESIPEITDLDSSFRCPICKEIFESPRIFKTCQHTFCNLCIIRYLTEGKKCPQCRQQASTSDLIPNLVLETICSYFKKARQKMVQILKKDTSTSSTLPFSCSSSSSTPTTKSTTSKSITTKKKMQTLCYDLLSVKQLKENLKKLNLPTDGDKPTLIKRHREFVLLYNTNLDKHISDDEIRQQVLQNEEYGASKSSTKKRKEIPSYSRSNGKNLFEELAQKVKQRPTKVSKQHLEEDVSKASASESTSKKASSQNRRKVDEDLLIVLDGSSSSSTSNRSSLASADIISLDASDDEEKQKSSPQQSLVFESRREEQQEASQHEPLFSIVFNSTPPQKLQATQHLPSQYIDILPSSPPKSTTSSLLSLDLSPNEREILGLSNPTSLSNTGMNTANEIMQLLKVDLSPPILSAQEKQEEKQEEEQEKELEEAFIQYSPVIFSTYVASQQQQQKLMGSLDS